MQHGYQLCVHAIGDRANRETLDIFEEAFKAQPRQEGSALARRARAAPQPRRHPALRRTRRDSRRCRACTARPTRRTCWRVWADARRRRRLRLAEADEVRRRRHQRHRRARWRTSIRSRATTPPSADEWTARASSATSACAGWKRSSPTRSTPPTPAFEEKTEGIARGRASCADIIVLSKDILTVPERRDPDGAGGYTIVGGKVVFRRANSRGSAPASVRPRRRPFPCARRSPRPGRGRGDDRSIGPRGGEVEPAHAGAGPMANVSVSGMPGWFGLEQVEERALLGVVRAGRIARAGRMPRVLLAIRSSWVNRSSRP